MPRCGATYAPERGARTFLAVSARARPTAAEAAMTATRLRNIFRNPRFCCLPLQNNRMELQMNGLIYLIGLIVVIMVILSLLGLR
jgi:hypothetical protein